MLAPMPVKDAAAKKKSFSRILELKTEEHLRQVSEQFGETPTFIGTGKKDFHRGDACKLRDSAKSSKDDDISQLYQSNITDQP